DERPPKYGNDTLDLSMAPLKRTISVLLPLLPDQGSTCVPFMAMPLNKPPERDFVSKNPVSSLRSEMELKSIGSLNLESESLSLEMNSCFTPNPQPTASITAARKPWSSESVSWHSSMPLLTLSPILEC